MEYKEALLFMRVNAKP